MRISIALKNSLPWPGSKKQTLGPVESTPTTTSPTQLRVSYVHITVYSR
jgi:hypothetical protein